jgi:cytochrome oxidase Cu insertion factor (SCO1/SenC/PrrC family)
MRFRHALFVLFVAMLPLVWPSQAVLDARARSHPQRGSQPAPDFSLAPYADGRKVSLSDVRGNVVLLYFWFPT